jgi:pimeloyl-ACP methyl ester carboxylesterase
MHAARALKEVQAANFPDFAIEDWLTMAKRGMVLHSNGRIAFDYDMKIAEPIMQADAAAVPPDMWPAYEALSGKPLLLVRGALSGLFSESTFAEMQRRIPAAKAVTIPNIGHAPTLDEPAVHAAITELLTQVSDNLS